MLSMVSIPQLNRLSDPEESKKFVYAKLLGLNTAEQLIKFLARYVSWNGCFGPAVASFVGKVGRCETMFVDPDEPNPLFARRAYFISSFFHRALQEEYGDHGVGTHPDHAQLATSFLRGTLEFLDHLHHDLKLKQRAPELFTDPDWLTKVKRDVWHQLGYGRPDTLVNVFHSMGFMLASEGEAVIEFTTLDHHLRNHHEAHNESLVHYLQHFPFRAIANEFPAYAWISIHSNHEKPGVESEHFRAALQGVNYALKVIPENFQEKAHDAVMKGYKEYLINRTIFFDRAPE